MEQKRFLTADEVFQQFGIDQSTLEKLVESGVIQALADQGKYKYRSIDFAKLVKEGKIKARTAGEMFQVDEKGDMPFLKLKQDDGGFKFDDDLAFIELDEDALEEARANNPAAKTPVVPDKWFDDEDNRGRTPTSGEVSSVPATDPEQNSYEMRPKRKTPKEMGSDSDVRLSPIDDTIDLDNIDFPRSGSDSDVQLEGPLSSYRAPAAPKSNMDSDSDVRLAPYPAKPARGSDSDIMIMSDVDIPARGKTPPADSNVSLLKPSAKKPESDSDVTLSSNAPGTPAVPPASKMPKAPKAGKSDSDVVIVDAPPEPLRAGLGRMEDDSNVRLESPASPRSGTDDADAFAAIMAAAPDSDVKLSDSAVRIESAVDYAPKTPAPVVPVARKEPDFDPAKSDSDVRLANTEVDFSVPEAPVATPVVAQEPPAEIHLDEPAFTEIHLEEIEDEPYEQRSGTIEMLTRDFDVIAEPEAAEAEVVEAEVAEAELVEPELAEVIEPEVAEAIPEPLKAADEDFDLDELLMEDDPNSTLQMSPEEFAEIVDESEPEVATSDLEKTTLEGFDDDIKLSVDDEANRTLQMSPEDLAELHQEASDAEIVLEAEDAGIELASDSGITLDAGDFVEDDGIKLEEPESGITLQETGAESGITLVADDDDEINLAFDRMSDDSGIRLEASGTDSGIMLEPAAADSGITIEATDSGIRFDSGEDSGISMVETDSGISLEDDLGDFDTEGKTTSMDVTERELRDSAFDLSLSESGNTIELPAEDEPVASKGKSGKKGQKALALSEAFRLDDQPEVEDLDISDDLEAAGADDEEFASIDEMGEFEASDDTFESGLVSADDEDAASEAESVADVPVNKVRKGPSEPAWGLPAVSMVIAASVVMAATSTVLLGGIATMWTGAEAPGPAATLISLLAGMSPW